MTKNRFFYPKNAVHGIFSAIFLIFLISTLRLSYAQSSSAKPPSLAEKVFSEATLWRGTVGEGTRSQHVQMWLQPNRSARDSMEGEYFIFGDGRALLIVGEYEKDEVSLEESLDGEDVSGVWQGTLTLAADAVQNQSSVATLKGTWEDGEGKNRRPFVLRQQLDVELPPRRRPQ